VKIITVQEVEYLAFRLAQSPAILKDEVVMGIEKFIKSHLVKLESKSW
jgi:hypothetical protein